MATNLFERSVFDPEAIKGLDKVYKDTCEALRAHDDSTEKRSHDASSASHAAACSTSLHFEIAWSPKAERVCKPLTLISSGTSRCGSRATGPTHRRTKRETRCRKVVWSLLRRHFEELIAAHPVDAERFVAEAEKQVLGITLTPYPLARPAPQSLNKKSPAVEAGQCDSRDFISWGRYRFQETEPGPTVMEPSDALQAARDSLSSAPIFYRRFSADASERPDRGRVGPSSRTRHGLVGRGSAAVCNNPVAYISFRDLYTFFGGPRAEGPGVSPGPLLRGQSRSAGQSFSTERSPSFNRAIEGGSDPGSVSDFGKGTRGHRSRGPAERGSPARANLVMKNA